ncbi:hypothetical protein M407DRAFT_28072 [Tulasnella calospora MUT 4182]|uniref:CFEM domain-containing protein n=1 Tax=Tulasnella calospora MUT 4182 TaxID=1051891 RepID=A0A0C3KM52_9AGAM|nr:hypothetical protein M407DRAFT_28072 [Tulasnella calospora MUT 4182]
MRFSLIVLAAATLASAGSVFKRHNDFDVPWCAKDCVVKADPSPCKPDDTACLCVNPNYYKQVVTCVDECCSPEDAKKTAEVAYKYCEAAGIDIKEPIPKCGVKCVEDAPNFGCDPTDDKCFCESKDFIEHVELCFKEKCQGEDLKNAVCAGEAVCRAVGVDISPWVNY